ncbi:polysaccharide pyruvyl transferase family protein [Kocuria carniphila]|uniref:polysaccharide pyruvyl transferase family protein n=1 Tax=Kocuria carniphila TaxID=262208 RepID=UPI0021A8A21C|nr:polysaccharide pyruvyl transferase family protein [Kocuria carniphila]MCT1803982.1 polysaccharide pyruvyl transferase family protein [Kocuria carniphila]
MTSVYAHMAYVNRDDGNLGDKMGFHIADWMLGSASYQRLGLKNLDQVDERTVAIVGSLVAALVDKECNIVGGGLINANSRKYSSSLRVSGVRGFLTKSVIQRDSPLHRPLVIGDPGLLLSELELMPYQHDKADLGFIIHDVDRDAFFMKYPNLAHNVIDNYAPRSEFVEQLSRYRAVASTSLHGCIFCHSYGIPVAPFVLTDKVYGGDFKFEDYYSSYGLNVTRRPLAGSADRILSMIHSAPQPYVSRVADMKLAQIDLIDRALHGRD